MNDCISMIESYEREARKLKSLSFDYLDKAHDASTFGKRVEYRDKAAMYERLSKEKYNEARILKERIK